MSRWSNQKNIHAVLGSTRYWACFFGVFFPSSCASTESSRCRSEAVGRFESADAASWLPSKLGESLLSDPVWVYNNCSSYDELSDNIPLTENLAIKEFGEISCNYARLTAVCMTLGVQNMSGQEIFVDRLTFSRHRSFCARPAIAKKRASPHTSPLHDKMIF